MVISGTELARQIQREIQRDVEELVAQGNMRPHLGVVLVGEDPASRTYVKNKTRAASILGKTCTFSLSCMYNVHVLVSDMPTQTKVKRMCKYVHVHRLWCRAGISSDTVVRPSSVSQEELLELIDKMNRDWRVSGLLVQLPLPGKHSQHRCTRNNLTDHLQMSCCRIPLL